jgi:5'-phosphate synthase pdxT subunit
MPDWLHEGGDATVKIGVLALQGDFKEHETVLENLGVEVCEVRLPAHLEGLDGLILPGGESTTFAKLANRFGLIEPLRQLSESMPMWGTCAGLVFMARNVGTDQPVLGILDIVVERNAFGRQVDSFEEDLELSGVEGGPFHGIFIRAPLVREVGPDIEILCRLNRGKIVAVRKGHLMATSFHPELTDDRRIHEYFLRIVADHAQR